MSTKFDHVIYDIEAKNGELKGVHKRVFGLRCSIVELSIRRTGHLEIEYTPELSKYLYTTPVERIDADAEGVEFETKNTIYRLKRIEEPK